MIYQPAEQAEFDWRRMRSLVVAFGGLLVALSVIAGSACSRDAATSRSNQDRAPATSASPAMRTEAADAELNQVLKNLSATSGGEVSVAILHVETGRALDLQSAKKLPLYSVFKLPLAVAVLKDVEEKRLQLDQKVRVTPGDVTPGSQFNTDLWHEPVEKSVAELLELSIVRSDNTSSDKLLGLVGGPEGVTSRLRSLGFSSIDIVTTVREFSAHRDKPNTGAASDLVKLLSRLQKGELLQQSQLDLLLGFMSRAVTGEHRLRGDLPAGTPVADKSGTGEAGAVTNDVGIITLPQGKGHLAMAVLVSGSKLPAEAQEKLIADLARAAYDSYTALPAQ
jgi:beta-lactamase class A